MFNMSSHENENELVLKLLKPKESYQLLLGKLLAEEATWFMKPETELEITKLKLGIANV